MPALACCDQVFDDGGRNVVAVQRGIERRPIAARLRVEPVALQHAVVQRRVGIDGRFVDFVKLVKRRGAIGLIRGWSPESRGTGRRSASTSAPLGSTTVGCLTSAVDSAA